jgi:hypothetical protein
LNDGRVGRRQEQDLTFCKKKPLMVNEDGGSSQLKGMGHAHARTKEKKLISCIRSAFQNRTTHLANTRLPLTNRRRSGPHSHLTRRPLRTIRLRDNTRPVTLISLSSDSAAAAPRNRPPHAQSHVSHPLVFSTSCCNRLISRLMPSYSAKALSGARWEGCPR